MKRVYLFNTGCIRRALDSSKLHRYFVENGWTFTNSVRTADLILVSTCGAVDKTEGLSLTALKSIAKSRPESARLIVTGCLPKINPDKIHELGDFEFVPTRELDKLDAILNAETKFREIPDANLVTNEAGIMDYVLAYRLFRHSFALKLFSRLSTNRRFLRFGVLLGSLRDRIKHWLGLAARKKIVPYYNLRIAEGCLGNCSYCAIRFATGRLRSKPIDRIEEEFRNGLSEGHRIFQLVSEDTGCYGLDKGTTIIELLRRLLAIEGDYQLVLIDFCPQWIVKYYDELLALFQQHPGKVRELFVSLQSGSDRILKAMRRSYTIGDVTEKLKELKKHVPRLILRTTVIIGFPGETEVDFDGTKRAVEEIGFSEVELNKYEDRPGTESCAMANKVTQETIERRYLELRKCA